MRTPTSLSQLRRRASYVVSWCWVGRNALFGRSALCPTFPEEDTPSVLEAAFPLHEGSRYFKRERLGRSLIVLTTRFKELKQPTYETCLVQTSGRSFTPIIAVVTPVQHLLIAAVRIGVPLLIIVIAGVQTPTLCHERVQVGGQPPPTPGCQVPLHSIGTVNSYLTVLVVGTRIDPTHLM